MLSMRDTKDEIDHLGISPLRLDQCLGRMRMHSAELGVCNGLTSRFLGENTGAIGETIHDRGVELAEHHAQSFLELIVNDHMLVRAE